MRVRALGSVLRLIAVACFLAACGPKRIVCHAPTDPSSQPAGAVQVRFLGVGGVLVRWHGAAVMAAPLYSNPSALELALSEIYPDAQRIDAMLPRDVSDVRAILSGHSHYDHLMDVPYVALHRATRADVIGNDAMTKLLAPIAGALGSRAPPNRFVSLEREDPCGVGHHVQGTRFRIRAIPSEHSPQIGRRLVRGLLDLPKITLWRGEPESPLEELPRRAGEWPAGRTLAFIVDLLEPASDEIAFRIYYQDSPTRKGYGYPPPCLRGRAVDLAILTVGGATELPEFPEDIVGELQPRYVMGVHWEDFFTPRELPASDGTKQDEALLPAPGVNVSRFLKDVRKAQKAGGRAIVPCPDQVTTFVREGEAWGIADGGIGWGGPK